MRATPFFFPALLILPPLLAGCGATAELAVDYPLEPSVVQRINTAGGTATITLADSQTVSASSLQVDSLIGFWLGDSWTAVPIADISSITIPDREEEENWLLKRIVYGSAGGAAIGLADGIIGGRANIAGEVIGTAVAGGLLTGLWLPQTHWSFVRLSIRPPLDGAESARRAADRLRAQGMIPGILAGIVEANRRARIEPGFLIGRGNAISPGSDPSSFYAVGGRMSFGYRFWDRGELAFEFSLLSHSFRRTDAQEQVTRSAFLVTGTVFPFSQSAMYVQGGVGYGFYSALATYTGEVTTDPPVSPPLVSGEGPAVAFGTGVEFPLNERWSVRPGIRYAYISLGDLTLNDSALLAAGRGSHVIAFSLGLIFRGM